MRFENLSVFPVLSKIVKDADRFLTLDEGLKAALVEVAEVGAQPGRQAVDEAPAENDPFGDDLLAEVGDVNRVMVLNKSDRPLYLMPGEIIVGGKQDRCIAAETIVEADGKPTAVEVYCVEHGRWHRRDVADFAAVAGAFAEDVSDDSIALLSQQAAAGKFVASAGNLSKQGRYSVQAGKGQAQVWDDVGYANSEHRVMSPSDAFTQNYVQQDVREKLDPYLKQLQEPIASVERVVGVIVAINGKAEMADVFESTPLFKKLWPKLLKGYALDAIAVAEQNGASKICAAGEAKAFLDKAREADVEKTHEKGGLTVTSRAAGGVTSFSAETLGGMGGFGAGIHGAAY